MIRTTACLLALTLILSGCAAKEEEPGRETAGKKPAAKTGVKVEDASGPLAEALAKAKAEGKNVLVEYYAASCEFCTQMDDEVYSDEFVKDALDQVLFLRVHQDTPGGDAFEAHWGRAGTPSFVVLAPDGVQVGRMLTGFIEAMDLVELADWAAKPAEQKMPRIRTGKS